MNKWNKQNLLFDYPSQPKWAIGFLIRRTIGNSRTVRSAVIKNLGYANPGRAALRLDHLIRTGECSTELRSNLSGALNLPKETVDKAFVETERQRKQWQAEIAGFKEEHDRRRFIPRLVLHHNRTNRRIPIFVLALYGQRRLTWVEVPVDILVLDYEQQIEHLPNLLGGWQDTRDGQFSIEWLGQPAGFTYKPEFDLSITLDKDLRLMKITDGPVPESNITLRIQNRELTQVFCLEFDAE